MAPKRKRTTAAPEEAPTPKRQLRSSGQIIATPTSSPTKRSVASRRVPSPRKRTTSSKHRDVEATTESIEESDDELNLRSTGDDQARLPPSTLDIRYLSDETNTIRVSSPAITKNVDKKATETPKARRGRRPKVRAATEADEDIPKNVCMEPEIALKSLECTQMTDPSTPSRRRPTRGTPVAKISTTPARSIKRPTPSRAKAKLLPERNISDEAPSSEDEDVAVVQSTLVEKLDAHPTPTKAAAPSTPRGKAKLSPKEATPLGDSCSSSEEQEVSELAIISPRKHSSRSDSNPSIDLPDRLYPCFNMYRRAILKSLQCPSLALPPEAEDSVNGIAIKQLADLIDGTVLRAEGNSCLLLGPRGSGKSQIVDACLEKVAPQRPIILRLSGWVQNTDRHALREIAFQLLQQTGSSLLPDSEKDQPNPGPEAEEEENPFLDSTNHLSGEPNLSLPPSSHLHALIPVLLTLSRPVIVILDAFDLFALHPRQSLLYCLLDTVQNCRASSESRGIAVIGITSRVDTVQLLEKRVKSRFSGRTIRTAPSANLQTCLKMVKTILQPSDVDDGREDEEEWRELWTSSIDKFLGDKNVTNVFNETFGITRDFKVVTRILTSCILRLTPNQPYLSLKVLSTAADSQRSRPLATCLNNLSYPALCMLIASAHADTAGHKSFTFEMIYELFRDQVRALASAPVQVNGGNIGMMRCTREVLMGAFEDLIATNLFVCVAPPSSTIAKQFMKYRCVVDRVDVKTIIDKAGNTNLKKWLTKNQ